MLGVDINDWNEEQFNKLTGKYKHYCVEWDDLAIDETDAEIEYCNCFDGEEFKKLKLKFNTEYRNDWVPFE